MVVKHVDFVLLFDCFQPQAPVLLQDSGFGDVKSGNNLAGLFSSFVDYPLLD